MAYGYGLPTGMRPTEKDTAPIYQRQRGSGYGTVGTTAAPPPLPSFDINSPEDAYRYGRELRQFSNAGGVSPDLASLWNAYRSNPFAKQWSETHGGGGYFRGIGTGFKKGVQKMASREGRIGLAKVAAVALGGTALAGGFGGAAAGSGAGSGGLGLAQSGGMGGSVTGGLWGAGARTGAGMAASKLLGGGGGGGGMASWAPWVQGGSQLLSSYLDKRSSDKTRNQQQKNLQMALAQLTPEAIQQLVRMFYTQNYAQMMPQMQGAQQGLSAAAGRSGLTGAGVTQQLRAGIPGQFAQAALGQASNQALGVAGQRASTYAGAPVTAPYSFGGDLQGIMQMLGRYGLLRNNSGGNQQGRNQQNQWWVEGPGHTNVWT